MLSSESEDVNDVAVRISGSVFSYFGGFASSNNAINE